MANDKIETGGSNERREFLRKAATVGFVAPALATFSMSGLMSRPAAAAPNLS